MRNFMHAGGRKSKALRLGVLAALLTLTSASSWAESDKETAPARKKAEAMTKSESAKGEAVPAEPQMTTASFGDWIERCQKITNSSARVCEVAQTITVEGQNAPIAELAIGRLDKSDSQRLTLVLPVNVALTAAPKLKIGAGMLDLGWRRCVPGGCIADIALSETDIASLRGAANPGQVDFRTASGQEMKFAFSFRGLLQAMDALGRESIAQADSKQR